MRIKNSRTGKLVSGILEGQPGNNAKVQEAHRKANELAAELEMRQPTKFDKKLERLDAVSEKKFRAEETEKRAIAIGTRFYGYQPLFVLRTIEDIQAIIKRLANRHPTEAMEIYTVAAMIQNRVTVDIVTKQIEEEKTTVPLPTDNKRSVLEDLYHVVSRLEANDYSGVRTTIDGLIEKVK